MISHAGEHLDCGEVNLTKLAEDYAAFVDHTEWLDDADHELWDCSYEAALKWETQQRAAYEDDREPIAPGDYHYYDIRGREV